MTCAKSARRPASLCQHVRAAARQPRLERAAGDGIGHRGADAAEHPRMIEQHEIERDAVRGGDLERGVEILEEVGIEAGRQIAIVVDDAGAAVAEHEPADDAEAEAGHVGEVALDRGAPRGDAEMRPPHVGAEVEPVEDRVPPSVDHG